MTPYFPDPLFQHGHLLFDYFPLRDQNFELVFGRELRIFCLDYPTNVVFATLDLLPKNLYLFLLKENKLCIRDKIAQKWKPTSVVMAEYQTLIHVLIVLCSELIL